MGKLVVGVDGSEGSREALRWAAQEALLRDARVVAIHAWSLPFVAGPMGAIIPTLPREDLEAAARDVLEDAVCEAFGGEAAMPPIEKLVVEEPAGKALVEAAQDADLLVAGSRGHGGFTGLLLGSVSQYCAHRAPCPVVIIPSGHRIASSD